MGDDRLEKRITLDEVRDFIANEYLHKTGATSKLCRTIVFAMAAAIWAIFQNNGAFEFKQEPLQGLLLLSIYLFLDISQYFVHAVSYGILYFRVPDKSRPDHIVKKIRNIDMASLMLFSLKVIYLALVVLIFACHICSGLSSPPINQLS